MKTAVALVMTGLLLAGFEASAQTPAPRTNDWDIAKVDVSKLPPASNKTELTFDKDILPLFKASCVRCHGEERPRAGFRVDTLAGVLKGGRDGKMVVPGDSKKSMLVVAIAQIDPHTTMPPKRRSRRSSAQPGAPAGNAAQTPPPSGGPSNAGGPPPGGPGGERRQGPPPKPLTPAEVGLVRAWIDQGAK